MAAKTVKKKQKATKRSGKHPKSKIIACFSSWLRLGCNRRAGKENGVMASTIRGWKSRYPDEWAKVVKAHELALVDLRQSIAHIAATGLHSGANRAAEILSSASELGARELASLMRALSDIDGGQDRIWRLNRELPTEIVEKRTDKEALDALGKGLEELGVDIKGTPFEELLDK